MGTGLALDLHEGHLNTYEWINLLYEVSYNLVLETCENSPFRKKTQTYLELVTVLGCQGHDTQEDVRVLQKKEPGQRGAKT